MPRISDFVRDTCKLGQGADCCKYLSASSKKGALFNCEKLTDIGAQIETLTHMTAKSDNCPGLSESDWKKKLNRPALRVVR